MIYSYFFIPKAPHSGPVYPADLTAGPARRRAVAIFDVNVHFCSFSPRRGTVIKGSLICQGVLRAWPGMWSREQRMQAAFPWGWGVWGGAGKGWQGLCAVPTPGCGPLTACGRCRGCLSLSTEDLLPFNPLFQDEMLIVGASVQPGRRRQGLRERRLSWGSLSPGLGHLCPLSASRALSHHPGLPCPVLSSGENIPVPVLVLFTPVGRTSLSLPATGQSRNFPPSQIPRLWIHGVQRDVGWQ